MKAHIELNKDELKRFVNKKTFQIKFPSLNQRRVYIVLIIGFALLTTFALAIYSAGYGNGKKDGFSQGYSEGQQYSLDNQYLHMSLTEGVIHLLKNNLNLILMWGFLVIAISWVVHGVQFRVLA